MEVLSIQEIVRAVDGELIHGDANLAITGISTDTRSIKPGDLFFALKADHDGHAYVSKALELGAAGVVISDETCIPDGSSAAVMKVDDTLWAFGDLAAYYRSKFDVKVVAITGSVGKTSTKEMLAGILGRKWNVLKNELNYNNEIGVPQTLFRLDHTHEVVVLELAMRGLGEIRRLASIAKPHIGVITNVGISHIERLGSQGAIADAKAELLAELPPDGVAVLNYEDCYYLVMKERHAGRVFSFGSCNGADVLGTEIHALPNGTYSFELVSEGGTIDVTLPVLGHHSVFNAIAAAAVAVEMGLDLNTIKDGLESSIPSAMRMELIPVAKKGFTVLNDAYNANPASMSAALRTLRALNGYSRKIAVLGNMLELGDYTEKAHRDIGSLAADSDIDILLTVGESGRIIADGARDAGLAEQSIYSYSTSAEAGEGLNDLVAEGDVILIKGSRGVKMENILSVLNA